MSEKDRFDWNDDVEFEGGADQVDDIDCFESSLDGFEDFDDASDYGSDETAADDSPAADAWDEMDKEEHAEVVAAAAGSGEADEAEEAEADKSPENRPKVPNRVTVKRRAGLSAVGMGFLFAVSILVAGIGVGGAVLFAEGVDPASLWQPGNLLQVDQLLNFSEHPLNILYMVSLGITFLALLGSYRMGKVAVESNARTRVAEEMLDKVCALRFDEQEAWRDEEFKAFPPAEEFVIKTLGAWRLQEARQKRLLGVEGEIHRLEKALAGGERTDLTGRYDSPAVGRLVDEMLRHFDAREAAVNKAAEVEKRDTDSGHEILDSVHESRDWTWSARKRVEETMKDAAGLQGTLAAMALESDDAGPDIQGLNDVIAGARKDLTAVDKTLATGGPGKAEADALNELVDRGSKLAFQIAMEVTRLGPRGDRLTPMSQALEDLTTGFRKAVDALPFAEGGEAKTGVTKKLAAKLDTLEELVASLGQSDGSELTASLEQVVPVAANVAKDLDELADEFTIEGHRLDRMGASVASLTGNPYEPDEATERTTSLNDVQPLELVRQTPADRGGDVKPLDLERTGPTSSMGDDQSDSGLELDRPKEFMVDLGPDEEEALPDTSEEVYDLDTFGAAPVTGESPAVEEEDEEVFDLDTFGAAPLDTAAPEAGDEETVYDLDTFGADPVVDEGEEPEPVYEMADLGGSQMEDAAGEEGVVDLANLGAVALDASADEDGDDKGEVFDLDNFGAQPLD